jgi:hypothetical protein
VNAPDWTGLAQTVRRASKWCISVIMHQNGAMDEFQRTALENSAAGDFMVKLSGCQRTNAHLLMPRKGQSKLEKHLARFLH